MPKEGQKEREEKMKDNSSVMVLAILAAFFISSCRVVHSNDDQDVAPDADADTDSDIDSDIDGDIDIDVDGDADGDVDIDVDIPPPPRDPLAGVYEMIEITGWECRTWEFEEGEGEEVCPIFCDLEWDCMIREVSPNFCEMCTYISVPGSYYDYNNQEECEIALSGLMFFQPENSVDLSGWYEMLTERIDTCSVEYGFPPLPPQAQIGNYLVNIDEESVELSASSVCFMAGSDSEVFCNRGADESGWFFYDFSGERLFIDSLDTEWSLSYRMSKLCDIDMGQTYFYRFQSSNCSGLISDCFTSEVSCIEAGGQSWREHYPAVGSRHGWSNGRCES